MSKFAAGSEKAKQFAGQSPHLAARSRLRRSAEVQERPGHITPEQCRMARAALQLTVKELADRAGVSASLISRFEHDCAPRHTDVLERIQSAFEARGIHFTRDDGLGVQLRNS